MPDEGSPPRTEDQLAAEIGRIFLSAHRAADEIVAGAERTAEALVGRARHDVTVTPATGTNGSGHGAAAPHDGVRDPAETAALSEALERIEVKLRNSQQAMIDRLQALDGPAPVDSPAQASVAEDRTPDRGGADAGVPGVAAVGAAPADAPAVASDDVDVDLPGDHDERTEALAGHPAPHAHSEVLAGHPAPHPHDEPDSLDGTPGSAQRAQDERSWAAPAALAGAGAGTPPEAQGTARSSAPIAWAPPSGPPVAAENLPLPEAVTGSQPALGAAAEPNGAARPPWLTNVAWALGVLVVLALLLALINI